MSIFRFVSAEKDSFPVSLLCSVHVLDLLLRVLLTKSALDELDGAVADTIM